MLASAIPSKVPLPFANSGTKNTIPTASQIGITPGAASLTDGFPPLTLTPVASGGLPPFGADFNGIFNLITAVQQWQSAGGSFAFDSVFSTAIGGYPQGAILLGSDKQTCWLNLADNNTTNPDTAGVAANWIALDAYGIGAVTGLTNSNVTLTPAQYSKLIITLSGTLTGNVQIIFPASQQQWTIINNTSGAYTVTCKTNAGTGGLVGQGSTQPFYGDGTNLNPISYSSGKQIQPISASVGSNALTISASALSLDFRSTTLGSGTVTTVTGSPANLVVPSSATLGTISATQSRLAALALNNAGTIELAVVNIAGGNDLTETGLISTTAISSGSTANNVVYSTTARTSVAYRIIGYIESTQATAGTWATAPSTIQGEGGQAIAAMSSLGYGQVWQAVTRTSGTTYYNTTGKPIVLLTSISPSTIGSVNISINGGVAVPSASSAAAGNGVGNVVIPPNASYLYTVNGTMSSRADYELR